MLKAVFKKKFKPFFYKFNFYKKNVERSIKINIFYKKMVYIFF